MTRTTHSLTKGEKILLLCIGLFVALIGGGGWWWVELNATPQIDIPTPELPVPNAWDSYVKAGEQLADRDAIADASLDLFDHPLGRPLPDPKYDVLVKKNVTALGTLRASLQHPCCAPAERSDNTVLGQRARLRNIARLLSVEQQVLAAGGDWSGVMQSGLDGIAIGTSSTRGVGNGTALNGIIIANLGRIHLWTAKDHLTPAQTRQAIARLEPATAQRAAWQELLTEEKRDMQAALLKRMSKPNWRKAAVEWKPDRRALWLWPKRGIIDSYTKHMDAVIANAAQPYAVQPPYPPLPKDPLSRDYVREEEGYRLEHKMYTSSETQDALLLVTLALQAYRQEHKTDPATLKELAPGYLQSLPRDPFALAGTFQYRKTTKGYILYSVGPDGKDDGGTPCKEGTRTTGSIEVTSVGDVVAGVNVQ